MPTFDFTAPDGTKLSVTGPEGATQEQAFEIAKQQYSGGGAAAKPTMEERLPSPEDYRGAITGGLSAIGSGLKTIDEAKDQFLTEAVRGVYSSGAGLVQRIVDQFSPEAGAKIGKFVGHDSGVFSTENEPRGLVGGAGRLGGEIAPYLVSPLSPLAQAIVGGATQLETDRRPDEDQLSIDARALGGGAIGGLTYGALKGVGSLVTRLANSGAGKAAMKEATDQVKSFSDRAVELDPALIPARGKINQDLEKKLATFNSKAEQLRVEGDIRGAVPMANLEEELKLTRAEINKLGNAGNKTATKLVKDVVDDFAPYLEPPQTITSRSGITLTRTADGRYELPGGRVLNQQATDALVEGWKKARPGALLSALRGRVEQLDQVLADNPGSTNAAVVQAGKLRNVLQDKIDEFTPPHIKAGQTRLDKFYEKEIAPLRAPEVDAVLKTQDPLERANLILDIATGDNARNAEVVAKMLGSAGRDGVFRGIVKKAMDEATDLKTNAINPEKFTKFFERPGAKSFLDKETTAAMEGWKALLQEAKDLGGDGTIRRSNLARGAMNAGIWAMTWGAMHGGLQHAAAGAAKASIAVPAFTLFDRMMNDGFGRRLLAAAGQVKPGTPRWARLTQTMIQKFGAPLTGEAGGEIAAGLQ